MSKEPLYPHVPKRKEPLYPHQREVPPRFSEAIDMIQAGSTIDEVVKAKVLTVEQADTLLPIYKKILANRHLLKLDTDAAIKEAVLGELSITRGEMVEIPLSPKQIDVVYFRFIDVGYEWVEFSPPLDRLGPQPGRVKLLIPKDRLEEAADILLNAVDITREWTYEPAGRAEHMATVALYNKVRDAMKGTSSSGAATTESKEPFIKVGERVRFIGSSKIRYETWPEGKWLEYGVTGTVTEYHLESPEVRIKGEIFEALPQYAVVRWDLGGAADTAIDPIDAGKRWERIRH